MASLRNLLTGGRGRADRDDARRLKAIALGLLETRGQVSPASPADWSVSVNEIVCADPACPGSETVILVMAPGRRSVALKVQKPMAETTEDDVAEVLARQGLIRPLPASP
jgi:hypothetical protein